MRPNVLTIAGFDPSAGAGVLADIKTFEQLGCLGMGVITANTIQTEDTFLKPGWINENEVLQQLDALLNRYNFQFAKIGLIKDFELLEEIKSALLKKEIKVIWDPVLSTSTGFDFNHSMKDLKRALVGCYLVTPNENELNTLKKQLDFTEILQTTNILHKGGHTQAVGTDVLYTQSESFQILPNRMVDAEIHGSGCILSSAITAHLAKGSGLLEAIQKAKSYVEDRLLNNQGKLAYHA